MPKLKSKEEAVRQVTRMATILKRALDEKLTPEIGKWTSTQVGKGNLNDILGKHGKRFKDVVQSAINNFGIRRFTDADGEIEVIVIDPKKPVLNVRRLKKK